MEELMAKYLADELNANERADFESLLIQDEQLSLELEAQMNLLDVTIKGEEDSFDEKAAWDKVSNRTKKTKVIPIKRQPNYSFLKVAAVLIVLAVAGYLVVNNPIKNIEGDSDTTTLASAEKGVKEFELPDGSFVKLNANSKLMLAEGFGVENRNLTLIGEGNFDVFRDENMPFVITAGNSRVKVLGTSFNLTTYPDEDVELNVTEGRVQFASAKDENIVEEVTKGEIALMDKEGKRIQKGKIKNTNFSGWWTRKLDYENVALREVLADLEDTYWVKIQYDDKDMGGCPLTSTIENQPTIQDALEIVKSSFQGAFKVTFIKENQIKLEGKPCDN